MSHYIYKAYNLNFHSCIPLPQLDVSEDQQADVIISRGKIDWHPPEQVEGYRYWYIDGNDVYYYWQFSGKYLIKDGKKIIFEPLPEVTDEHIIGLPILGPVIAMLLHQRNYFVLHGSGIKIDNNACVFLGCKGQGKSTMAATLYSRGHKLVADDITAVTFNPEGGLTLTPGFPQIKLWPDSIVASTGDDPEKLPEIYPNIPKRSYSTFDNFFDHPLPLKRIYILGSGYKPEIKRLNPQEALKQLVGNSYIPLNLGNYFVQSCNATKHFFDCTKVINQVAIYSLNRPRDLDLLPEVASLVEQDMEQKQDMATANLESTSVLSIAN